MHDRMAMSEQVSPRNSSESDPLGPEPLVAPTSKVEFGMLEIVFLSLFAQLALLILFSLVLQRGPTFVGRAQGGFSMDFGDFYLAGRFHSHHVSVYRTGGFVWPPFSMLVGLLFQSIDFAKARYLWLALNLGFVVAALAGFARQVALSARNTLLLFMIAGLFYPLYFLLERGHIDGLMLACLVFAFRARHWALRSLLYGLSIGLKLYSALLVLVLARKKCWAMLAGGIAVSVLLQLPWPDLALEYPQVLLRRTTSQWIMVENISPAPLFYSALGFIGQPVWKLAFLAFWLLTLLWSLLHLRAEKNGSTDWVLFVPWMIAMPLVVYPYSAVLTLPLLAYLAKQMEGGRWGLAELLFAVGFVLVGTQQNAWVELLTQLTDKASLVYQLNSLGTALLMISCCMFLSKGRGVEKPILQDTCVRASSEG